MQQPPYHDADYAFGQVMLTLRTAIRLTQAALAEYLGVSRRAVGTWESGDRYPSTEHLKQFITLAVQQGAFPVGREEEEIRALWRLARQRVLLDEVWLAALLVPRPAEETNSYASRPLPVPEPLAPTAHGVGSLAVPSGKNEAQSTKLDGRVSREPRVDWDEALVMPTFFGREWELRMLREWVVEERCRVVGVLGIGGIGKSALTIKLMHEVAEYFDVVIWRSLRDAPTCEALLDDCMQVLASQPLGALPATLQERLDLLLNYLRNSRALLVLDNLETILEEGEGTGRMRAGYEAYQQLLRRVSETDHQSCLLFTSREKPGDLASLEGSGSPVRLVRLARLDMGACERLLREKGVRGAASEQARLIDAYGGNPLALKIVAHTIIDLFDGEIAPFLEQGALIFGGVRELLAHQFERLSPVEQSIMFWLAIMREPVTLGELRELLVTPLSSMQLLEGVEALHNRSLVERGKTPGSFTLQSVVLEYVTARLISQTARAVEQDEMSHLIEYGLELAQVPEYVRQTQERVILAPVLAALRAVYPSQLMVEERLTGLLRQLATRDRGDAQGYGPANLVAFLRLLRGNLQELDLSGLAFRSAYLQGVEMQDASLAGATIRDSAFTDAFDIIVSVAISNNGQYWAACSRRGEVWIWEARGLTLQRIAEVSTRTIVKVAFSPDGDVLAGGGWEGAVMLWASASGALLWSSGPDARIGMVYSVAFAPDGRRIAIASSGENAIVQLRERESGMLLQTLPHPAVIAVVTWSPDGRLLASGDVEGAVRLWAVADVGEVGVSKMETGRESEPAACVQTFLGHKKVAAGLAFAPDGQTLASASLDGTVKLWDVRVPSGVAGGAPEETPSPGTETPAPEGTPYLRETLGGHTDGVRMVAWSPDGHTLASAGWDNTVLLWDTQTGRYRAALRGHSGSVRGLAFTPDSRSLVSGSSDGTIRVWDVGSGQCVRLMQGYTAALETVDWSPDGRQLVCGGSDELVTVHTVDGTGSPPGRVVPRVLRGHRGTVYGLGWSPAQGGRIAAGEWDNAIRLWDPGSGDCVQVLQHPEDTGNSFIDVAWSPDGQRLAAGTNRHGVMIWDMPAQRWSWSGEPFPTPISGRLAWSPQGTRLAAAGGDGAVYVWDAASADGTLLQRLAGHPSLVVSLAWSADGLMLAAGSAGMSGMGAGGQLTVWDVRRGERLYTLAQHPGIVNGLAWGVDPEVVVSGSEDGRLRWWNVVRGECLRVGEGHQGSVPSLRRSPDGTQLASCSEDGAIMLWDLQTGEHLQTLRRDRPYERLNITGIRGLTEAQKATLRALGAVEQPVHT